MFRAPEPAIIRGVPSPKTYIPCQHTHNPIGEILYRQDVKMHGCVFIYTLRKFRIAVRVVMLP